MTVAGVRIGGTDDQDPAEYPDGGHDVGELLDPLVDGAEVDETTKAKQNELDRRDWISLWLWERSEVRHAGSWTTEERNQSAIRRKRVQER